MSAEQALTETLHDALAAYCRKERVKIHVNREDWDDIPIEVTFEIVEDEMVFESAKLAENYLDNEGVKCIYQFGDDFDLTDKELTEALCMAEENATPEPDDRLKEDWE
jgi:hypothetical protein